MSSRASGTRNTMPQNHSHFPQNEGIIARQNLKKRCKKDPAFFDKMPGKRALLRSISFLRSLGQAEEENFGPINHNFGIQNSFPSPHSSTHNTRRQHHHVDGQKAIQQDEHVHCRRWIASGVGHHQRDDRTMPSIDVIVIAHVLWYRRFFVRLRGKRD